MSAALREREVEKAWLQHEPWRRIEARRAATAFKASIAGDAAKVKRALGGNALPLVDGFMRRGALGRPRKLLNIKAALSPAHIATVDGGLLVQWQESRGPMLLEVDHPSFQQNCIIVVAAMASRVRGSIRWSSCPVIEVTDHTLARMFLRAPGVDASAAIYEAATSFLHADRNEVEVARLLGADVCLPCGGGLALCLPFSGPDLEGKTRLIARGFTWIELGDGGAGPGPSRGGG